MRTTGNFPTTPVLIGYIWVHGHHNPMDCVEREAHPWEQADNNGRVRTWELFNCQRTTKPAREPIHDAVRFCRAVMDKTMDDWGMHLEPEEYEDSISELLIHALRLERRYDPQRNESFAGYARSILERRAVDAGPRRILGRYGTRLHNRQHETLDETNIGHGRPHTTQPGETSDHLRHWGQDRRRLHGDRARPGAGAYALLGLGSLVGLETGDARPTGQAPGTHPDGVRVAA